MPDWLCNLFSHVWPSIPGKEFNEATDKWLHCLLRGNPEDNSAGESGVYIWRNQPHCRGQGSLDVVTSRCGHCSMNTMVVTQGVSRTTQWITGQSPYPQPCQSRPKTGPHNLIYNCHRNIKKIYMIEIF